MQLRFLVLSESRLKSEESIVSNTFGFLIRSVLETMRMRTRTKCPPSSINLSGVAWQFFSLDPRTALRDIAPFPPSSASRIRRISLSWHRPPLTARDTRAQKKRKKKKGKERERGELEGLPPSLSLHGGRPAIKILMVRFRPRTGQSTNYSGTARPSARIFRCSRVFLADRVLC